MIMRITTSLIHNIIILSNMHWTTQGLCEVECEGTGGIAADTDASGSEGGVGDRVLSRLPQPSSPYSSDEGVLGNQLVLVLQLVVEARSRGR